MTDELRQQLQQLHAEGGTYRGLARQFGISRCAVKIAIDPGPERARNRRRYVANIEHERARKRRYRAENLERVKVWFREWREANPERMRELGQRRRALQLDAEGSGWPTEQWETVVEHVWAHKCAYCEQAAALTVDHVVPLSKGGSHLPSNLVPACKPCNSSKGPKLLAEWRQGRYAWIEEFAKEIAKSIDAVMFAAGLP